MAKAGTKAGMGWCRTRLVIQAGILAPLLVRLASPSCPLRLLQGYSIGITWQPIQQAEHYIGLGVSRAFGINRSSDASTRRLWYKRLDCSLGFVQSGDNTCLLGEKWFNRLVHSDCGNVICYSIGAYTGGLGDPRVSHAHLVRHTRWQPISDSVSRSTSLLPSVP